MSNKDYHQRPGSQARAGYGQNMFTPQCEPQGQIEVLPESQAADQQRGLGTDVLGAATGGVVGHK